MSDQDCREAIAEMLAWWEARRSAFLAAGCSLDEAERLTGQALSQALGLPSRKRPNASPHR